jgi:hypothetical protein
MKRKALIVAACAVGILVLGVLCGEAVLKHYVRRSVERALGDAGARVELGRVAVSLPRRQVALHRVRIVAQDDHTERRTGGIVSLDVAFESLTAQGIRLKKRDGRPAVSADKLTARAPKVTLVTRQGNTDTLPARPDFLKTISERLSSLDIGRVEVTDGGFEQVKWLSDSENTRLLVADADLSARDITLTAPPAEVSLAVDSIVYAFGAGSKVLRAEGVALDGSAGTLAVDSLELRPQYPKHEYAQRSRGHEDWTAVSLGAITFEGVDFERLITERRLSVDSVSLASARIASYKNRQVYQPPHTKPMLYQTIQRLPLPIEIASLNFDNLDVTYEELAPKGTSPGTLTLTDGKGRAVGVTNIAEGHDRFMTLELSATLEGGGTMTSRALFPVSPADNHWEISGHLDTTDMRVFNRAMEPLMNVRITSGEIRSLDFATTGTLTRSHTDVVMAYSDLGMEFLDRKHDRRGFLTVLVDGVLIRPDNPGRDGRGKLRESEADYERDPERSMWHYIWHSVFAAILKTVV